MAAGMNPMMPAPSMARKIPKTNMISRLAVSHIPSIPITANKSIRRKGASRRFTLRTQKEQQSPASSPDSTKIMPIIPTLTLSTSKGSSSSSIIPNKVYEIPTPILPKIKININLVSLIIYRIPPFTSIFKMIMLGSFFPTIK